VFAVLHKPNRAIDPITVVATVDPDGTPRTAPFGSLRAVTPRLLRLACNRYHDTYANLRRDGRVMVALLAPPNIAVSIRGQARVVKERMDASEHLAIVEIEVEEVKNDMMRRGAIKSAVGFSPPEDLMDYYLGSIAEIEDM
jgi:flavin reductase (DIM6/NTAB) family NADH-FMN oxidoreductase RutF